MKKKIPAPAHPLPVDFGNEPLRPVPIQKPAPVLRNGRRASALANGANHTERPIRNPQSAIRNRNAFTLVEILVVLVLLSLIVFALMAVFSGTQRAFRASLTQTDILQGGRALMDLISSDMETMTTANWQTNLSLPFPGNNNPSPNFYQPVNFYVSVKSFASGPPSPLYQTFVTSPSGAERTNLLEDIFILSKGNINGVNSWICTGYSVATNLADGTLYPLYRFYMTTNASAGPAGEFGLFNSFTNYNYADSTNWSHMMDGVVNLTVHAYDTNGVWMTNGYVNPSVMHVRCVRFNPAGVINGVYISEPDCVFYSNAVPASVVVQLATLEDRTLQHAEGLAGVNQSNYLANSPGQVHVFRQHVWIRNVDPTAYQ